MKSPSNTTVNAELKVNGSSIASTAGTAIAFNEHFTNIGFNLIHDSDASFEQFIKSAESKFSRFSAGLGEQRS